MSRLRIIGSYVSPATASDPGAPRHAIMMQPGGISSSAAVDGYLFPIALSAESVTAYRWLYRAWKINITYHQPLVDFSHPEQTGELEIIAHSDATSEGDLATPEPPSFHGPLSTTTGTITTDDGVNPPIVAAWNPAFLMRILSREGDFIPPDAPDTNNYHFNTATGLYLPRVEFDMIGPGAGHVTNYAQADDGNVNTQIVEWAGTWDGEPITLQVLDTITYPLDSFTFVAVPWRAWPYNGASGDIWDEDTFAEIESHSTILD